MSVYCSELAMSFSLNTLTLRVCKLQYNTNIQLDLFFVIYKSSRAGYGLEDRVGACVLLNIYRCRLIPNTCRHHIKGRRHIGKIKRPYKLGHAAGTLEHPDGIRFPCLVVNTIEEPVA